MALIQCPDCNKQVSANAPTCPGCGAPIAAAKESSGSGVSELTTTQGTSKELKKKRLQALGLFVGGFLLAMIGGGIGDKSGAAMVVPLIAVAMIIGGGIWYLSLGFKIWWHHK